ncbi:hemerythrin domain-containing protein [Sphingomonas sanxanigenens]|uniref:Hemerythrin-like domain-containing protein n=1 Tax=Sphingomonas sanxanigenens DSM 19645 = NX02 TaxID=1123269 RepID=W0AA10_9SPHN|nr:hemerythrin domain-containing protein [Sphingomonas sanxanigenens]AHE53158.1 hypothetical protein NX02_07155 [Sphingomonas sanxanigenens DSM 19645 = NX02]
MASTTKSKAAAHQARRTSTPKPGTRRKAVAAEPIADTGASAAATAEDPVSPSASFDRSNVFKIAGAAALGVVAGLAANFGRKLAVQAPTVLAGGWRDALAAEHKAVLRLFELIEATDDSQTARRSVLLTQIKHALGKHAFQEENVIYPALRDHGEGTEAERLVSDHGEVKHALFELERMPRQGEAFIARLRALRSSLEVHMRAEEEDLFPLLDARLDEAASRELTSRMNKEGLKLA